MQVRCGRQSSATAPTTFSQSCCFASDRSPPQISSPARHENRTGTSRVRRSLTRTLVVPDRFRATRPVLDPFSQVVHGTEHSDATENEDVSAEPVQTQARAGGVSSSACPNTRPRSDAKRHARRQLRRRRESDHHFRWLLWGGHYRRTA